MTDTTQSRLHKIATFLINNRYAIVALFLAITIAMMFAMSKLRIETGFKKQTRLDLPFFDVNHRNIPQISSNFLMIFNLVPSVIPQNKKPSQSSNCEGPGFDVGGANGIR